MYIKTNYTDTKNVLERVNFNYRGNAKFLNHRFSDVELLNLAGGIPDDNFYHFEFTIEVKPSQIFELRVDSSYHVLTRTVDLFEMEISNDSFIVNDDFRGRGLGTKVTLNQIREAKNKNFNMLSIFAIGGADYTEISEYNGYAHWAKYGYEMFPDYQNRFRNEWSGKFNAASLREFACDSEKYHMWELNGFSWAGFFRLNDARTISFLRSYIEKQIQKGFNYELWPEVFE